MNALKHYINLVRKAQSRQKPEGYTEKHHIFPVSVFGDNNRVVVLTAREHYVAHLLLWKAFRRRYGEEHHGTIKSARAVWFMSKHQPRGTSRLYDKLREDNNKAMSYPRPQEWKDNISQGLRGRVRSPEHCKNISLSKKGMPAPVDNTGRRHTAETKLKHSIDSKGRKWWNNGVEDKMTRECPGDGWVRGRLYTQKLNKKRWT